MGWDLGPSSCVEGRLGWTAPAIGLPVTLGKLLEKSLDSLSGKIILGHLPLYSVF